MPCVKKGRGGEGGGGKEGSVLTLLLSQRLTEDPGSREGGEIHFPFRKAAKFQDEREKGGKGEREGVAPSLYSIIIFISRAKKKKPCKRGVLPWRGLICL